MNKIKKSYFLPVSDTCLESCDYCPGLGCRQKKDKFGIKASTHKAQKSFYESVLLPCNFLFQNNHEDVLKEIQKRKLIPIIQINSKSLHKGWMELLLSLKKYNCSYLVVIDNYNESQFQFIEEMQSEGFDLEALVVVRKNIKLRPILSHLKVKDENLYFYYPLHLNDTDPYYETNWVKRSTSWIKNNFPSLSVKPYPSIDTFDPRINEQLNLEPFILPNYENNIESDHLKVSVIIPTYNFKIYVTNTIRHLLNQTLPKNEYEIIVVDDGSTDETEAFLLEELKSDLEEANFKYIYFPRVMDRKMGDGNFRAGIARNLGVKHAKGDYLCFLDSDIITPNYFLQQLLTEHQTFDVIQTKRHYLKKNVSGLNTNYSEINIDTDTFIPEGGYWHNFYSNPTPWMQQDIPWKYVCTYSLSLLRKNFVDMGCFKKNYHFYGFEDTCLGLRSWKNGLSLHLSDLIVYHLFHANERSEYKNSDLHRMNLLKKTAKIFYHNHLDDEIYSSLGSLVNPGFSFKNTIHSLSNWWNFEK